ncbi:precorrin-6A synthase (deacetylating) [Sulfitobacter sp. D35]|uniref:precorrin-6A synthase (deacetylating) n=1 Tax=Sulfitobacter sp. D35 TaxID=3083252 RepID=UPI00296F3E40|nr:precorrin-6A synthase (deacetylating) [Sulfitobacter sp. D35]MDW4496471.1 precorrin-6A synthase (deacetylating) [Sulfitobacter sp. D35]
MTELLLVGIGTGNPDHITLEGRKALQGADLILIPRKGPEKSDLAELRRRIVLQSVRDGMDRVVEFDLPVRDPDLPYLEAVERWHDAIAELWAVTLAAHPDAHSAALLVWGDPSLYDSTLRIAARLDPTPKVRVIPGITALQALTAAHAIPLNTLAGSVEITTGRRLRDTGWPDGAETVAVMLDGACAFETLDPDGLQIWWGAYLGMDEQILSAGPLEEAAPHIMRIRAEARDRHGWIMDTYLLRRTGVPG